MPTTRTNLCRNPSFDNDTSSWNVYGGYATVARSTLYPSLGTYSGLITWAANTSPLNQVYSPFTAITGHTYTLSVDVYVPSGSPPITFGNDSTATSTVFDAKQRLSHTFVAGGTGENIVITPTTGAGGVCYIDKILFEESSSVGTYFDGSFTGAVWNGTPGSSTSTITFGQAIFSYTGSTQSWVVPPGVPSIDVTLVGADGATCNTGIGGSGATVRGTLATTPGDTIYIEVGGAGVSNGGASGTGSGGWPGGGNGGFGALGAGGGGGGRSAIYTSVYLAFAGAGGGASGYDQNQGGGGGGPLGSVGGTGGGYVPGKGGTQTAGGAGGNGAPSGAYGAGGAGYGNTVRNGPGGGGAGYYGGGGGGLVGGTGTNASGAGGGSSFAGYLSATSSTAGNNSGGVGANGSITFTYNTIANPPTLNVPANNSIVNSGSSYSFTWTPDSTTGDQVSAVIRYRQVGTSPWTQVTHAGTTTTHSFAAGTFTVNLNYEWQVQVSNYSGPGAFSSSHTFTTTPAAIPMSVSAKMLMPGAAVIRQSSNSFTAHASISDSPSALTKIGNSNIAAFANLFAAPKATLVFAEAFQVIAQMIDTPLIIESYGLPLNGTASLSASGFRETFADTGLGTALNLLAKGSLVIQIVLGTTNISAYGSLNISPDPILMSPSLAIRSIAALLNYPSPDVIPSALSLVGRGSLFDLGLLTISQSSVISTLASLNSISQITEFAPNPIVSYGSLISTGIVFHSVSAGLQSQATMIITPNLNLIGLQTLLGNASLSIAGTDSLTSVVNLLAKGSLVAIGKDTFVSTVTMNVFGALNFAATQYVFRPPYLIVTLPTGVLTFTASASPNPRDVWNSVTATNIGSVVP